MINLLPPDLKESVTYARRNILLVRWIGLVMVSFAGVALVVVFGLLYMSQSISANQKQIADTQAQLKVQKLEETQKRVEDISGNLKLVIQVLSKQVLFSELLKQTGAAMPSNAVLTNLSINKLQGGIDLEAAGANYAAATQVQINLQDPKNKIFSKADIVSVRCDPNGSPKYPCTINIRAQFSQQNSFLLLENGVRP